MVHKLAFGLAKVMAFLGCVLLLVLVSTTCLSVLGRSLNTFGNSNFVDNYLPSMAVFFQQFSPINGDFELVEMGMAFAIMLFFPWCQLNMRHASVDVFTLKLLPQRANLILSMLWDTVLVIVLMLVTYRLYAGMNDRLVYNETTFLLQWPVWWAYAACTIAAGFASLVGLYSIKLRYDAVMSLGSASA